MTIDIVRPNPISKQSPNACERLIDMKADVLLRRMSNGDEHIMDVCGAVLSSPLSSIDEINRRQAILRDMLRHTEWLEAVYAVSREAVQKAEALSEFTRHPKFDRIIPNEKKILSETELMKNFIERFKEMTKATRNEQFQSVPLCEFARQLCGQLSDDYLDSIQSWLTELDSLRSANGLSISIHLGDGMKWGGVVVSGIVRPSQKRGFWKRATGKNSIPLDSAIVAQNADEMVDASLRAVYITLSSVNRAMEDFCRQLCDQLGFYVGCERLYQALLLIGVPVSFPEFVQNETHKATALMDASLVIKENRVCAANTVDFSDKRMVLITGRNQGGKTTFLRSVGLAQIMGQSGMFVTAQTYICPCFSNILTHFPNGEDERMDSGLLDAELKKLSEVVDQLDRHSLLLMNESFQTTTDDEANDLAVEIVTPLCQEGVKVLFVTHLYAYAKGLWNAKQNDVLFLSPDNRASGMERYRMRENMPCESASGTELFQELII